MGGHGGLNILPQKSWNVYNRKNRERVAQDEAQADTAAANARVEAAAEQARKNLQELRARVASEGGDAAPPPLTAEGHVNFFADVEAAERNAELEAHKKREEARIVARLMPDLDLSKSCREPRPWYVQPPEKIDDLPPYSICSSSGSGSGGGGGAALPAPHAAGRKAESDDGGSRRKRRHESDDEGGERRKKHRRHQHQHERRKKHKHERRERRRSASPSPAADSGSVDALAQLRQERLERERLEQRRALQCGSSTHAAASAPSGRPAASSAIGAPEDELRERFFSLTGQAVSLKPRDRGPFRREAQPSRTDRHAPRDASR
jgi:hypothetical protein